MSPEHEGTGEMLITPKSAVVRLATLEDIEQCVELAKKVYEPFLIAHGVPVVKEDLRYTARFLIGLNQVLVVEHEKICGMAAWVIVEHPANRKCKMFQEILWCIESDYVTDALLLMRAIEKKAVELKVDVCILGNLSLQNEPRLRKIYGKRGYEYLETHYSRRF